MPIKLFHAAIVALGAALVAVSPARANAPSIPFPGSTFDFHGFVGHNLTIDGRPVKVAEPQAPLPGKPWLWRTAFWDAFPNADISLLKRGFTVAYIDGGDTWGCPDAMAHFDAFYKEMTTTYGFSEKPALEGLSRGGLYAYRWASLNPDKVGCIYGDAPLCDLKSLLGKVPNSVDYTKAWQAAIRDYHFKDDAEMMAFPGNPVDTLAPLAAAHVPIIHVVGDADHDVPMTINTDIMRERYLKLGGTFVLIVKQGCEHHPHGLNDPTEVVDFIVAHAASGDAAAKAAETAPKVGAIITLAKGMW